MGLQRRSFSCFALTLSFQYRLGHFLYEQRDTVGALDNLSHDICRHLLTADKACNDGGCFAFREPIKPQAGGRAIVRSRVRGIRDGKSRSAAPEAS